MSNSWNPLPPLLEGQREAVVLLAANKELGSHGKRWNYSRPHRKSTRKMHPVGGMLPKAEKEGEKYPGFPLPVSL